jgi:uncharacterized cupredoxin-like copper-binding protein
MRKGLMTLGIVVAGSLVLAACGDDGSSPGGDTGAATPTGESGNTIAVSLGEEATDSMYLRLSEATAAAGPVTFVVTNEGQKVHEFIVIQTDTPAGDFPLLPEAEDADHNFDEAAVGTAIDEVEDLAAGDTQELTVTLDAGHYALACNIRPHYENGMWADFDVA